MPKAELHVHVEGTLETDMAFALAERNGISLDPGVADALRDGRPFTDLQAFLDRYYACSSVLRTEQDFFDPQSHTGRGVDLGSVVRGLDAFTESFR